MNDGELQQRRRGHFREKVKDSRALEALLLAQDKQLEYERQRQLTLDAEAEMMDAESKIGGVPREYHYAGENTAAMRTYTAVIEQCPETSFYVGYVPGFPGAHSQGETLDELNRNLREVIEMLLEDCEPASVGQYVGTQTVSVP